MAYCIFSTFINSQLFIALVQCSVVVSVVTELFCFLPRSESNDLALQIARVVTEKEHVISIRG